MPRLQLSLCCSFLADSSRMPPFFASSAALPPLTLAPCRCSASSPLPLADRVTLPSEAIVAPWRSVADSFTLAMSKAPPTERLPPVFSLLSLLPAPRSILPDSWLSLRVWVDSAACSATLLPALRVTSPWLLTSVPCSVRSRPAFSSTPCWPLTLPTCAVLLLLSPLLVPPPKPAPKFLLSAVKPPFAEALTLKPLWFSLCLSLA